MRCSTYIPYVPVAVSTAMVYQDWFLNFSINGCLVRIRFKRGDRIHQLGINMGSTPVQSPGQETVSSSLKSYAGDSFLSVTGLYAMVPMIPAYMEILKDGRRLIMKLVKDDYGVVNWLSPYVGVDVTVNVPQLGISWTSRLSFRRGQGYIYVRVPANLRGYLLPFWQSGLVIPVIISIPPVALATRVSRVVGNGQ